MGSSIGDLIPNEISDAFGSVPFIGRDLSAMSKNPLPLWQTSPEGYAQSAQDYRLPLAVGGGIAAAGGAPIWGTATPAAAGGSAALGTGITPGAGGVTGLTPGVAGASGITGAAPVGTALAPGFFGSEGASLAGGALVPGAAGGNGGAGGAGGGGAVGSSIPTAAVLAAGGIPAALGAYGAYQQAKAQREAAAQYQAMGAPYRSALSDLYSNPEDFLNSPEVQVPIQQATNIMARSLSRGGNPAGSGNALQELQNYAANQLFGRLGQEKDRLGGFGGLTAYNQAAPQATSNAINSQKGIYDALGAGAADIFNPPKRVTLQDLLRGL